MTIDIDRLEALARSATSGPWKATPKTWPPHVFDIEGATTKHDGWTRTAIPCEAFGDDNAAFIAAANPAAVLELIERVRAAESIVRDRTTCFEHADNVCAEWCAHCKAGIAWERRAVELQPQDPPSSMHAKP